ncbi:MAG: UPF0149 family protein [Candidatus Marinimicrobia bacterium]|nr:UPF0149 family protein [Candidatus Neomarinimicrobiota bacterium]
MQLRKMLVNVSKPFSDAEIDALSEFLISDESPEECMDISTLDGFLTGLVIGPDTIMPSRWLPVVWGETKEDQIVWETPERAERIMGLVMRLYNSIVQNFQIDPPDFNPLFYINKVEGKEYTIIDEWCWGFMQSVELAPQSWLLLLEQENQAAAIYPISLHGTEEGWDLLSKDAKISKVPHEEWVTMLPATVLEVHEFWLPFRRAEAQISQTAISPKVGRNEPCPCGSGKKYKKCCGAPESLS